MKKFSIILFFVLFSLSLFSQELKCNIQVISSKIQGTNRQVFQTMQNALYEFMNSRVWTKNVFSEEERIECNFLLQLNNQISVDEFEGTLQIQSRRPVYGSSYNTTIMNYVDKDLHFKYVEFETLEYDETTYLSNLTSILAFWAYIIIGLDYDTFSTEGGSEYFKKAETVVDNAQQASGKYVGWVSYETNKYNRYWVIENIQNTKYSPIREFLYDYHRLGLDIMSSKVNEGRQQIAESLILLQKVYRDKPDLFMPFLNMMLEAKSDEFVNIFSESFADEKARVVNILNEIDPSNTSKYKQILQSNQSQIPNQNQSQGQNQNQNQFQNQGNY